MLLSRIFGVKHREILSNGIEINKISDSCSEKLFDLFFSVCDYITLKIPDYNNVIITEKNKDFVDDYDIVKPEDRLECYEIYKENAKKVLEPIMCDLEYSYQDVEYADYAEAYLNDIYVFRCTVNVKGFIKKHNLFSWSHPDLPEDICFYKDNKCFMRTVAHENMCLIYENVFDTVELLKKCHTRFSETEKEDISLKK